VTRASRSAARQVVLAARPAVAPREAPAFVDVLTTDLVTEDRAEVRQWQQRMRSRGWDLDVDGRFGARSAHVAARFAVEKGISTAPGTVNQELWDAAWEQPVS
jgi:hypothetical protein